ncbi:MAG: hypothetical protein NVSMB64_24150 [Candidatus Velthaea sp.]
MEREAGERPSDAPEKSLLERPRLVESLNQAARFPIAAIVAGSGFGASTAIQAFARRHDRCIVIHADSTAPTVLGFLGALAEAAAPHVPGIHLSLAIAYERTIRSRNAHRELASWFREHVAGADLTIALDGVDRLQEPLTLQTIIAMIEATLPHAHWILSAADASQLPLDLWLSNGSIGKTIDRAALAFSGDEALALARLRGDRRTPDQIAALVQACAGRASTLDLAMHPALQHLGPGGFGSEEDADRLLAGELIASLPQAGRTALASLSLLGTMDPAVLARLPIINDQFHTALHQAPQLFRKRKTEFAFAPVCESLLAPAAADRAEAAASIRSIARVLENGGRVTEAIALLERDGQRSAALDLVDRHGVSAIEDGQPCFVAQAASLLGDEGLAEAPPTILAIKALAEAANSREDTAESYFVLALDRAVAEPLRAEITYRYALFLMRHERIEAIELVEAFLDTSSGPPRPALLATLATAYAVAHRTGDAARSIASALDRIEAEPTPAARARVLHQAAFVAVWADRFTDAVEFATRALSAAAAAGAYDVCARASSVLYHVANESGDPLRALRHLDDFARYALLAGDIRMRHLALVAALDIEAERGNIPAIERIEEALESAELSDYVDATLTSLIPAQALHASWSGDFEQAYAIIAGTAETESRPAHRALRFAEIAMHAAAAGRAPDALDALIGCTGALVEDGDEGVNAVRARVIAAFARVLLSEPEQAREILPGVAEVACNPRVSALAQAVASLTSYRETGLGAVRDAIAVLRKHQFGGYAMLIEALPRATFDAAHPIRVGAKS